MHFRQKYLCVIKHFRTIFRRPIQTSGTLTNFDQSSNDVGDQFPRPRTVPYAELTFSHALQRHLGKHLQQLALFILRPHEDDEHGAKNSVDAEADISDAIFSSEGSEMEFMSNPSRPDAEMDTSDASLVPQFAQEPQSVEFVEEPKLSDSEWTMPSEGNTAEEVYEPSDPFVRLEMYELPRSRPTSPYELPVLPYYGLHLWPFIDELPEGAHLSLL
jgi:hypothetical protein